MAALPEGTVAIANDAGDAGAAEAPAEAAREAFGRVDGLFLNAGYRKIGPNEEMTADFFDRMNDVNVRGPVLQLARFIPLLNDGASVLITAPVSPYLGQGQGAVYAGTKGAVTALARSWAADLAPRGIRVNSIAPGPIATNFGSAMG